MSASGGERMAETKRVLESSPRNSIQIFQRCSNEISRVSFVRGIERPAPEMWLDFKLRGKCREKRGGGWSDVAKMWREFRRPESYHSSVNR